MIPKQFFFIWFGEHKDWIDYAIQSYRDKNPDYNINLIEYSIIDLINSNDSVLCYCKDLVMRTWRGEKNKYYDFIRYRLCNYMNFFQIVHDIMRFELLYYYGGIYCDCDTWCTKPLQSEILNGNFAAFSVLGARLKNKVVQGLRCDKIEYYPCNFAEKPHLYNYNQYNDIYFLISKKEYVLNTDITFSKDGGIQCKSIVPVWIRNFENSKEFKNLRKKFYNLDLSDNIEFYNIHPIIHFNNRTWDCDYKNGPLYSEYDDYIYSVQHRIKRYL